MTELTTYPYSDTARVIARLEQENEVLRHKLSTCRDDLQSVMQSAQSDKGNSNSRYNSLVGEIVNLAEHCGLIDPER